MFLRKRDDECVVFRDGSSACYDSFWYSDKGQIVKWVILALFFSIFMGWFVGGYIHAKRRLRKGLPLLAYHRFLIPYSERKRHGQVPQNHFTFYAQPGHYNPNQPQYAQQGQQYAEPPPLYQSDAPPQYFAPQGASKVAPQQGGMEMPQYGVPAQQGGYSAGPQGGQQSGVVGGANGNGGDVEGQALPPRPQQAKAALRGFVDRFRR